MDDDPQKRQFVRTPTLTAPALFGKEKIGQRGTARLLAKAPTKKACPANCVEPLIGVWGHVEDMTRERAIQVRKIPCKDS